MMLSMMLLQSEVSTDYVKWLTIFTGILAISILLVALAVGFLAVKVVGILNDVKKTFDDTKVKAMPLIAKATEIAQTAQGIVGSVQTVTNDLVPKVKVISENAVEMSHTVRGTVSKLDVTIRDAADKAIITFADFDTRAKNQVARVDGMVASTLSATAEIGATVNDGIRAPARKIAAMLTQSKHLMDTLVDRARALGINLGGTVESKVNPKTTKGGW